LKRNGGTCELLLSGATAFAKLFVQEQGTDALIRLMEAVEDNRKLISASTPLEVYAAVRRRERAGASRRKTPRPRSIFCAWRPRAWCSSR
jgi:nucleotidyltransferase/DNA polymerase involved in DNA repair